MNRFAQKILNTITPKTFARAVAIYGVGIPVVAFSHDYYENIQYERTTFKNDNGCDTRVVFKVPEHMPSTVTRNVALLSFANFARIAFVALNISFVWTGIGLFCMYEFDEFVGFLCGAYFVEKTKTD